MDEWYPQQAWLNSFETIAEDLEPHLLDRLGEQIPTIADWPASIASMPDALQSIDDAYQRNHRGGDIGSYRFEQLDDRTGRVVCTTLPLSVRSRVDPGSRPTPRARRSVRIRRRAGRRMSSRWKRHLYVHGLLVSSRATPRPSRLHSQAVPRLARPLSRRTVRWLR